MLNSTVLPFGLATAAMLFTKPSRPLAKFQDKKGINICIIWMTGQVTKNCFKIFTNSCYVKKKHNMCNS